MHDCGIATTAGKDSLDNDPSSVNDHLIVRPLVAALMQPHHAVEHRGRKRATPDVARLAAE